MNNDKQDKRDEQDKKDKKDDPHASNLLEDKKPGFKTPEMPSLSEVGSINEQADKYYKAPEDTGEGAPTAVAVEPLKENIPPNEVRKRAGEPPTEEEQRGDELRKEMKEGVDQGQQQEGQQQSQQREGQEQDQDQKHQEAEAVDPDDFEEEMEEEADEDGKPHRGKTTKTLPGKRKR